MSHGTIGEESKADPNLVPLLDVVLQLIMFFMLTVDIDQKNQNNAEVHPPISQWGVPPDRNVAEILHLNVNRHGQLLVEGEKLEDESKIKAYLRTEKDSASRHIGEQEFKMHPEKFLIVLHADKRADWKAIARIQQACIDLEIKTFRSEHASQVPKT